jgi:filamentous hemagglutinin family protein
MTQRDKRQASFHTSTWIGLVSKLAMSGALLATSGNGVNAQIEPDNTLGKENSLVNRDEVRDRIDGGARRGANLFHSFREFNIGEGRSAYFTNPNGVENIFSRVTGSNPSEILGRLGVEGGNANLFLMNPNGIIFGDSASLDVNGSFVATTANAIEFGDRGLFSASNPNESQLLSIKPSAFFYNQIAAQQSAIVHRGFLQVPDGKSLLLLGGNVTLDFGYLIALGGRVELSGVSGTGSVQLTVDEDNLSLSPNNTTLADVSLTNNSLVSVVTTDSEGGDIDIAARSLSLTNGARLDAGTNGQGNAGNVNIKAGDTVSFDGNSGVFNIVEPEAEGNAGNINIESESLSLSNSRLESLTRGQGDAGNVNIEARETVSFEGSDILSTVESAEAEGNAGDINIESESLSLTDAELVSLTRGQGDAGNVNLEASDTVSFEGSVIFSTVEPGVEGNAGNINIESESLSLTDTDLVSLTRGQGDAGNVNIEARNRVSINGSAIFSTVEPEAVGNAGEIEIKTGSLSLTNGAELVSLTRGQGDAGNVNLEARNRVSVEGSVIFSTVVPEAVGNAGSIKIESGSLFITDAQLLSLTRGQGDAGKVNINARNQVSFDRSTIFSRVEPEAVGNAGEIEIKAGSLSLTDAQLLSQTRGQGNAANVNLEARNRVSFDGNSGIFTTVEPGAVGDGRNVNLKTESLFVTNGARLNTGTSGKGDAGNINIDARNTVSFDGSNGVPSAALTNVEVGAQGNAGNVNIKTGSLSVTNGAQLESLTRGQGNAANVNLEASETVSVDGNSGIFTKKP